MSERTTGGIALGVSTLVGSTFNAFAKSISGALSSLSLLFVSELLTAFFILFSFGVLPVIKKLVHLHRKQIHWLLVLSALTSIIGPLLLFSGIALTSAINVGFFGKMQIVFLLILARFSLKESIKPAHLWAMACVMTGICIIIFQGFSQGITLRFGDLLILGSTFSYALGNIVFRTKLHKIDSHLALIFRSGTAVATFFLISPFLTHPFIEEIQSMPLSVLPALIGFAFFARFLSNITYYAALDRLHVTTVSLVGSLDVIGATVFAHLYLGEVIYMYHIIGGAFVLLGTVLLNVIGTHPTEKHLEAHLKQNI